MPLVKKPLRYAHPEGHTDVCYFSGDKGGLITCGPDGDVRSWLDLMDDDPSATCVSEQATAVLSKNGKIYVGNDNNTVQILSYPDLEKEGIVTRFSAAVSALSSTKKSNLIVSGSCDMRIQVTNLVNSDSWELNGHEAPILGLSLDPKEEFVASSSADGTIRVWKFKEKRQVHAWNNVLPKCNSFFTARLYGVPSFQNKTGEYLSYPQGKEVLVFERDSWKELFRLKSSDIKNELSISKFSECGKYLAASSVYGEIIVWEVESKDVVGYIDHSQNAKITNLVWKQNSKEIAFCDSLGQLSCVDVITSKDNSNNADTESMTNGLKDDDDCIFDGIQDDDDDGENVISLSKIKASVLSDDEKSVSDTASIAGKHETKKVEPEFNLQEPFQPGSSPIHLMSRYMMWNDVGTVMCFNSENGDESTIDVNFHDVATHHSLILKNYHRHTMAALSSEALILACPSYESSPSKIVTIALQGWGSGNKEWTVDLPEGEEVQALAAGTVFVAAATSVRNLRIFMVGGTQREVIAIPGPVVSMAGYGNNLAVAYHSGVGAFGDQILSLLWIRICGPNLRSHTLSIPLSPSSNLMWLGFSDIGSPVIMDAEGVINIFDKKSGLWRVACDTNRLNKGKFDHYFIIGIEESQRIMRCILCKGSRYPLTTPKPIIGEVNLTIPLCEPDSEKTEKEIKIWQMGSHPVDEKEAVLSLIALACRNNVEYRAVDLCQQIASQKVIELAIKYAAKLHRMALANKLESIADVKESDDVIRESGSQEDMFSEKNDDDEEDILLPSIKQSLSETVIKPLTPSQTIGRRNNRFLKTERNSPIAKGLAGINKHQEPLKISSPPVAPVSNKKPNKPEAKPAPKENFLAWYGKNKPKLEKQFPELNSCDLTKKAFAIYRENVGNNTLSKDTSVQDKPNTNILNENNVNNINSVEDDNDLSKKRKLDSDLEDHNLNQPKRSNTAASKLAAFART